MNRRKKRYSARPVLYIDQPDFKVPTASMQADYFTPKVEKEDPVSHASVPTDSKARLRKSKRKTKITPELETQVDDLEEDDEELEVNKDFENEESVEEVESSDQEEEEEPQILSKDIPTKKPFSEMTIEEQVEYLATKPTYTPKMKCEINAESGRYRGVVTAFDANIVQIETFKRPKFHQLDIGEIESIRLLGF